MVLEKDGEDQLDRSVKSEEVLQGVGWIGYILA